MGDDPTGNRGDGADPPSAGGDSDGLSVEKRDEIVSTEPGQRPDPSLYLAPEYISQHLEKFQDGATRFMPESNLEKYGIAQRDGTSFVIPKDDADAMLVRTQGDPRALERELGLPEHFLDSHKVVRVDVPHPNDANVRMPSGNEAGANDQWLPGGRLPDGTPEAVIDGGRLGPDSYNVSDLANADVARGPDPHNLPAQEPHGEGGGSPDPLPESPEHREREADRALAEDRQSDCADYLAAELGERLGRTVDLPGEPSPSGRPARIIFEEFEVGAERTTHAGIEARLLAEGPGSTGLVVSRWSAEGASGHGYLAVNDGGVIRLADPETGRVSGWPPYWGDEAVSRVAAGFFDADGQPLTPLRSEADLRAADEVGDIGALPRRTLVDPGPTDAPIIRERPDLGVNENGTPVRETDYGQRTVEIVSNDSPTDTSHPDYQQVSRSLRVLDYPVGAHPRWPEFAVREYHVTVGGNEAVFSALGEPVPGSDTASRYHPHEVRFIEREVFGRVDRPWTELAEQGRAVLQAGDAGGHMLSFLGFLDNGAWNLFSQDAIFNNTAYRSYENYQNDFVRHGALAEGTITLVRDGIDARPERVEVDVQIRDEASGERITKIVKNFSNDPHQQYHRPHSGPQIREIMKGFR